MKRTDGVTFHHTTPAQLAYIREHWATQTCIDIEAAIGVRRKTVKSIASRLGLKKDPAFLSAVRVQATLIGHQRTPLRTRKPKLVAMPFAVVMRSWPPRAKRISHEAIRPIPGRMHLMDAP